MHVQHRLMWIPNVADIESQIETLAHRFQYQKNSKLFYFDRGGGSVPCIQQMSVSLMRTSTQSVTETGPAHFCLTTPVFVKGLKGPPCELYEPGGGDSHI